MRRHAAAMVAFFTLLSISGAAVADDPRFEVLQATRAGADAEADGRTADALRHHERAVEVATSRLAGSILEANALDGLAFHHLSYGDPASAVPLYERSLELYRRLLSGDQPRVATTLHNLAVAESRTGRPDDAGRHAGEALEIWSRLPAGRTAGMADTMQLLANLARRAGQPGEAEALDRRARNARTSGS